MINSIINLAKSIRAGKVGVIDAIKIGDVTVSALTGLSGGDSVEITERAVQAGFLVTEAVVRNPRTRTLDIILADPQISLEETISSAMSGEWAGFTETWRDKKEALYAQFKNRNIVNVITHDDVYSNMLIRSITPIYDANENWDCFVARVELREWDKRSATTASDVDHAVTADDAKVGAL